MITTHGLPSRDVQEAQTQDRSAHAKVMCGKDVLIEVQDCALSGRPEGFAWVEDVGLIPEIRNPKPKLPTYTGHQWDGQGSGFGLEAGRSRLLSAQELNPPV